jgi:hypothetical protein
MGTPKLLDREVVIEPARRTHRHQRVGVAEPALTPLAREVLLVGRGEAPRHVLVEGMDVLATELHDVDEDQHDVGRVVVDAALDQRRQLLEVVGEVGPLEELLQLVVRVQQLLPVVVEQLLVDGLLGPEVVVEVAERNAGLLRDLPHRGGAVALGREEPEGRLSGTRHGRLGSFGLSSLERPYIALTNRTLVRKSKYGPNRESQGRVPSESRVMGKSATGGSVAGRRGGSLGLRHSPCISSILQQLIAGPGPSAVASRLD